MLMIFVKVPYDNGSLGKNHGSRKTPDSLFEKKSGEKQIIEVKVDNNNIDLTMENISHAKGDFFINNQRNSFVPPDYTTMPHNLSYVQLNIGERLLTICNVYGASWPTNKLDSADRLLQSQKILDFVLAQPGEKIIAGDFNLLPNTRSIMMFEENGFRNLIKDFNISTTRGSTIKKLKPELGLGEHGWQEFADYTFISSGIKPIQFTVPDLPISDHLPMILEFKI